MAEIYLHNFFSLKFFLHLYIKPKDIRVDQTFTRKIIYGIYFLIEILEETQQIFNHDRKHETVQTE